MDNSEKLKLYLLSYLSDDQLKQIPNDVEVENLVEMFGPDLSYIRSFLDVDSRNLDRNLIRRLSVAPNTEKILKTVKPKFSKIIKQEIKKYREQEHKSREDEIAETTDVYISDSKLNELSDADYETFKLIVDAIAKSQPSTITSGSSVNYDVDEFPSEVAEYVQPYLVELTKRSIARVIKDIPEDCHVTLRVELPDGQWLSRVLDIRVLNRWLITNPNYEVPEELMMRIQNGQGSDAPEDFYIPFNFRRFSLTVHPNKGTYKYTGAFSKFRCTFDFKELYKHQIMSCYTACAINAEEYGKKYLSEHCLINSFRNAFEAIGAIEDGKLILSELAAAINPLDAVGVTKLKELIKPRYSVNLVIVNLNDPNNYYLRANTNQKWFGCSPKDAKYKFRFLLWYGHYMNDEVIRIPKEFMNHLHTKYKTLHLSTVLKKLQEHHLLTPVREYERDILGIPEQNITPIIVVENTSDYIEPAEPRFNENKYKGIPIYYADFEADSTKTNKRHQPYLCCITDQEGKIFRFFDKVSEFLSFLYTRPFKRIIIYFHNLRYDYQFISGLNVISMCENGSRLISVRFEIPRPDSTLTVELRDSYSILPQALKTFPAALGLDSGRKEVYPYEYYTYERYLKRIGVISEAKQFIDPGEHKLFEENIKAIPNCFIDEDHFDMKEYAKFYCKQDVKILQQGIEKYNQLMKKQFDISVFGYYSISSMAYESLNRAIYFAKSTQYRICGILRAYIQPAVRGGKTMPAYNRKIMYSKEIDGDYILDYDKVALYPYAMSLISLPAGIPKGVVFNRRGLTEFPSDLEGLVGFVHIAIKKINKRYPFPCIQQITDSMQKKWIDSNILPCKPFEMKVSLIYLKLLIEFCQIEYDLLDGYIWFDGIDEKGTQAIRKWITNIFNLRLEEKKRKSPMQLILKLMMNSAYGMTLKRAEEYYYKFKDESDPDDYGAKASQSMLNGTVKLKIPKDQTEHYNMVHIGILILDTSKYVMAKVQCLAYDLSVRIFYMDTDSMFIEQSGLKRLEEVYERKYHEKLTGTEFHQFHGDYEVCDKNENPESILGIAAIFLNAKQYLIKLLHPEVGNKITYKVTWKGIPRETVRYHALKHFATDDDPEGLMNLYRYAYNGGVIKFNIAEPKPRMIRGKDYTYTTKTTSIRTGSTNLEELKPQDYFDMNAKLQQFVE